MGKVEKITDAEFESQVLSADQTVVVDFYATWCPPCKRLAPILDSLAQEYASSVKFVKVDTDEDQAWAGQLGVQSLPTLAFFKDGELVDARMGLHPPSELKKVIDKLAG